MIFYYSGCGNSRWIADELAKGLEDKLEFIPDLLRKMDSEAGLTLNVDGDSLGFVFPIYAWAAPKLVEEFVLKVSWKGVPSQVWFACTCGDEMGLTLKTFRQTLAKAGLRLDSCYCFQMPETYLCFPGFHLDTEEGAQRKITAAKEKLPKVIESIRNAERVEDTIVGSMPRLKSGLIRDAFNLFVSDKGYRVLESCTGCGVCAKHCPLHNIRMVDGRPRWQGNCTQCMACYHYCPQNAIQYKSFTKDKGQYHF